MQCVGIDCRFATTLGGLGTYTRSIVHALLQRNDPWKTVLFVRSRNESWLALLPVHENIILCEAPFAQYSFSEQCRFPFLIRASGCDLFYSPSFNVPIFCPVPFVATIHDLILHRHPNQAGFLKRLAYRFIFGRTVRRARSLIAVSEKTKHDLLDFYPHLGDKITVSYPGVGAEFKKASDGSMQTIREKVQLKKPFLLYVGNCKEHKNVPMLLAAFDRAKISGTDLILVCGGKECEQLSLQENVRRIDSVETEDFSALYSAALGFVTATLDEGFGLPMVEAMACECPVLATRCGSIPEVCGDHALLVPPTVNSLSAGMRKIVSDPTLRSPERLDAAALWAKRYDWKTSAERVASLFLRELINSNK